MAVGAAGETAIAGTLAAIIAAILAVLARLKRRRRVAIREWLLRAGATVDDVDLALAEEERREVVYRKLAEERVKRGIRLAARTADPSARAAAIEQVMRRERIIAEQRASASAERVLASAELAELRRISPQGAYWILGERRTHTADCLAMANHFWPWEVLDIVHPLLHPGCGCELKSLGWAISHGLMSGADIPTVADALSRAASVIKHVEDEKAEAERRYGHLVEAIEIEALHEVETREVLVDAGLMEATFAAAAPLSTDPTFNLSADRMEEGVEQTGAMVALFPDPKRAKKLALAGGDPPEQLHVTLAFLGEAEDLDFEGAKAAVEAWAKTAPPMKGSLSGIGHFDIGKGQFVTYRSIDLPDLPAPRESLVEALDDAGVPAKRDHGFTPHMTLQTGPKLRRPPVKKEPISFSSVTLAWGGERHAFALTGKSEVPSAAPA